MLGVPQRSWRKTRTWTSNRWAPRLHAAWAPTLFTGTVWQEPIIEAPAPARIRGAWVRFEPKARTAWHTHPLGQPCTWSPAWAGFNCGRRPLREIRAGDTVWIAPGEKHWHGAGPDTNMVHIALQEALDGTHVAWLEHVTDEQYNAKTDA